jgi:hypothetical protein
MLEEEFVPLRDPRRLVIKLMENCFLINPTWAVRREAQAKAGLYDRRLAYSQDYRRSVCVVPSPCLGSRSWSLPLFGESRKDYRAA